MWKRLKAWWRADLDLQRLRRLDDRLLADLGFDRDTMQDRVLGRTPSKDPGPPDVPGRAHCPARAEHGRIRPTLAAKP